MSAGNLRQEANDRRGPGCSQNKTEPTEERKRFNVTHLSLGGRLDAILAMSMKKSDASITTNQSNAYEEKMVIVFLGKVAINQLACFVLISSSFVCTC